MGLALNTDQQRDPFTVCLTSNSSAERLLNMVAIRLITNHEQRRLWLRTTVFCLFLALFKSLYQLLQLRGINGD